jgi:hypothetical protein
MTIHNSTTIKWDNLQVKDANEITGVVGLTGAKGIQGEIGEKGEQGEIGPIGISNTLISNAWAATQSFTNATVSNFISSNINDNKTILELGNSNTTQINLNNEITPRLTYLPQNIAYGGVNTTNSGAIGYVFHSEKIPVNTSLTQGVAGNNVWNVVTSISNAPPGVYMAQAHFALGSSSVVNIKQQHYAISYGKGFNNYMPYKISNAAYTIQEQTNETYVMHGFVTIPNAQTTITMSTVQYYTSPATGNPLFISNKSYLLLLRIA